MEKRFFTYIGFGFAILSLIALSFSILHLISQEFTPEKKGDLATWVSAVGTIGTLLGAIWIASTSERRREEEQRKLADVMAASFTERLNIAVSMMRHVDSYLSRRLYQNDSQEVSPNAAAAYSRDCLNFLEDFPLWTNEELLAASPLPQNAARHIAAAIGRVQGIRVLLTVALSRRIPKGVSAHQHLEEVVSGLGSAILSMDIAVEVCSDTVHDLNADVQRRYEQQV